MAELPTEQQIIEEIRRLKIDEQERVLDFIRRLQDGQPTGMPGNVLLERAQEANFDPADLEVMKQAIEEGTEGIDWSEW